MLFVLLFVVAILIVPLILDAQKHPGDNIFIRSGRDLISYPRVKSALQIVHASSGQARIVIGGLAGPVAALCSIAAIFLFLRFMITPVDVVVKYVIQ